MRFNPGNYAILPTALAEDLVKRDSRLTAMPDVAIIAVEGAMTYSGGPDPACPLITYRMIEDIAQQAFAGPAKAVILALASPGGEVAGAFECARALRRMASASGKPFFAFVDNMAASAGYALVSACDQILATRTAILGSIGVVRMLASAARLENASGIDFAMVTSGALKALGNEHMPLDELTITTAQAEVNKMASSFFAWVSERRGIADPGTYQGGCFVGADAQTAGLCDGIVDTLDDAIAIALAATKAPPSLMVMSSKEDDKEDSLRASLVTASESDDPEKARKARQALAAYDAKEEEGDEKKEDDKASAEASNAAVAALSAQVASLSAQLKARDEKDMAAESAAFFASRPDLPETLVATLRTLPLAQAKSIAAGIPVVAPVVATSTQTPTLGQGQVAPSGRNSLSDRMLASQYAPAKPEVTLGGIKQTFGKVTPRG
jgi:ClpP class serine protease